VTKTQFVRYAGRGFWAYDVALGVLLKHLIDAAQASGEANTKWLSEAVSSWRVLAVISDYGFTFDEHWSAEQRESFIGFVEQACGALETRDSIPTEEIISWHFVDEMHIFPRGAKEVLTAPVIELGRAMVTLLLDELPEPPKGEVWLFGTPDGRSTLRMERW
jgi:hypothetical protein